RFRDSAAQLSQVTVSGPAIDASGSGRVPFAAELPYDFNYDVSRADLAEITSTLRRAGEAGAPGWELKGQLATSGRLTGRSTALGSTGKATLNRFEAPEVSALTLAGDYDATVPSGDLARADLRTTAHASFATVFGRSLQSADGTITKKNERVDFDL